MYYFFSCFQCPYLLKIQSPNSVNLWTLIGPDCLFSFLSNMNTSVILIILWFSFEIFLAGNNNLDNVFKNPRGDLTWRRGIIQKLRPGQLRRCKKIDFRREMRPNSDTEARFSPTLPCTWFYKLCGPSRANQLATHMPLIPLAGALGILGNSVLGDRWRLIRFNITFC